MMGSGKSTIGPLLAERLSMPWIDLDREIEKAAGLSIEAIWEREGEEGFRMLETKALARLERPDTHAATPSSVVGCGGGIVVTDENRKILKEAGRSVYLRASPDTLASRLWKAGSKPLGARPLLRDAGSYDDLRRRMAEILDGRSRLYEETADLIVDVDDIFPEEAVDSIARWWEAR